MTDIINIYCDESCHLSHDKATHMILGAIWCPKEIVAEHHQAIADLKEHHQQSPYSEIKWGRVSPANLEFHEALINYFFDQKTLHFRGWVASKSKLDHDSYSQTHDDWYYKMYYYMLQQIIQPDFCNHIYIDIKDTRGREKLAKLHDVLANANYDFNRAIIQKVQHVHSHEVGLVQLADLLIGAVGYANRNLTSSPAKLKLVELIKERSGLSLTRNTLLAARKINLCIWRPSEGV